MYIRSFILFKYYKKLDDGFSFVNPFSSLSFQNFPTERTSFWVAISFEYNESESKKIRIEFYNQEMEMLGKWKTFEFYASEDQSSKGVVFKQSAVFPNPGIYYYKIYADEVEIGKFSLVVKKEAY